MKKLLELIMQLLCLVVPIFVARLAGRSGHRSPVILRFLVGLDFPKLLDVPISSSALTES